MGAKRARKRAARLPLRDVLARVSRSFYVSLRLLPAATREAVSLAYLLARATDTVADTPVVPRVERLRLLDGLSGIYAGEAPPAGLLEELQRCGGGGAALEAERTLLAGLPRCLELLAAQPELERGLIREVLATITAGQRADLARFPAEDAGGPTALETRDELHHYCYQVAGCVGVFWSDLHAARLRGAPRGDRAAWREQGRRFGRALQLTNVLRDVPGDLRAGRCYLPREDLESLGLAPGDLLDPGAWGRLRPLFRDLAGQLVRDAHAGLEHALAVPPREVGLRLAEFVPLLLALETLGVVLRHNPLDPEAPRKVPRRTVYGSLARSFAAARIDADVAARFRATLRRAGLEDLTPPPTPKVRR